MAFSETPSLISGANEFSFYFIDKKGNKNELPSLLQDKIKAILNKEGFSIDVCKERWFPGSD
jgi:hypothetical protein